MCSFSFDDDGQLTPYEVHKSDLTTVNSCFVTPYKSLGIRKAIWNKYILYNKDLLADIGVPFSQWIMGSFISKKTNPNDIDIVNFIDASKTGTHLENYLDKSSLKVYSTDGYIIPVYNNDSPYAKIT